MSSVLGSNLLDVNDHFKKGLFFSRYLINFALMPRIKIRIPGPSLFTTSLQVRVTDLNYGNHLANDSVLSLCHEARVRLLYHLGLTELENEGIGLIMADSGVEYKSQASLGETIIINVCIDNIRKVGFDMYYELRTDGGRLVGRVKTGHVGFDYQKKKMVSIPAKVLEAVSARIPNHEITKENSPQNAVRLAEIR
ncbi:MAG: acyl-CoA thioester hydrolase [Limisphaerales bacterium]|jgi:acyl-CoA thioester hydrolase